MQKNYATDTSKEFVNNIFKRPGSLKVRTKDVLILKQGAFLGIEEYVDKIERYKYTAKVLSKQAKLMKLSVEAS